MNKVRIIFFLCVFTAIGSCQTEKVRIIDTGKVCDTINLTDALAWESKQMKEKAGIDYWKSKGFEVRNGLLGKIVAQYYHKDRSNTIIYIVQIDKHSDFFVPIEFGGFQEF
jgi:hypothetical protein